MGYPFRSRLKHSHAGSISVIQMKDLTDMNVVDCHSLIRVDVGSLKTHHLVKPGELIFRSRGKMATTALLNVDPGDAVVAAPLIRIQIKNRQILPEYLNWYFSQSNTQNWFAARREGTHGGMINKLTLEHFEVEIPSIKTQKEILEISELLKKENKLTEELQVKRNIYVSTLLMQLAQGE